jgi:3-oxoadipate enol-lactonase/4-carboxymuconolactone decarboxylase
VPTIAANHRRLSYDLRGPAGAPVIAFSNSLGATRAMWDGLVAELAGRWRCLTYDTRGHGASDVSDEEASVADLADDLAALLTALDIDRAHVAGLSLGGLTAQAFALRYPDRLRRLILLGTAPSLPPPEFWAERAALVRREGMSPVIGTLLPRWFTAPWLAGDPPEVTAIRDAFLALDPRGYARCCEAIADADFGRELGSIAAPTLVIAGADDPVTPPASGEALRQGIPGAELVVMPNAAHLFPVERPVETAARIAAFLSAGERMLRAGEGFDPAGLANRKAVLGESHVERSLAAAGEFDRPWQAFITRTAWGEIWGDTALPWKTRSLVTLALMVALGREEEFKLHLRPALRNGVSPEELGALLRHAAAYAGIPAGNAAHRWVREVLGEEPGRDG